MDRFDPSKPTLFKTDWNSEGIGWIILQPLDDDESIKATEYLLKTGNILLN